MKPTYLMKRYFKNRLQFITRWDEIACWEFVQANGLFKTGIVIRFFETYKLKRDWSL